MPFDPRSNFQNAANPQMPGPVSKLGYGSGRTGNSPLPGSQTIIPGYSQVYYYQPSLFGYYPKYRRNFQFLPPRETPESGGNGRDLVSTIEPHDFTPAQRQFSHMRRAANWQVQEYPPDFRNLLEALKVERFRTESRTVAARPLLSTDFFLGYQVNPATAQSLGYGGVSMGVLGSV